MDRERIELVLGEVPEHVDLDDELDRERALDGLADEIYGAVDEIEGDAGDALAGALLGVVANQLLDGDPPEVWAAAQRLLAVGRSRRQILTQLVTALTGPLRHSIESGEPIDTDDYLARLERLPLPTVDELQAAAVPLAAPPGIGLDDLEAALLAEVVRPDDDDLLVESFLQPLVEAAVDAALRDGDHPLVGLAEDRLVHLPSLVGSDVVHTSRLLDVRQELDLLPVAIDLPLFARRTDVTWQGEPLDRVGEGYGELGWIGPTGWLAALPTDALVAVRVAPDGAVTLEPLAEEPALDPAVVAAVRAAYDAQAVEGLPVGAEAVAIELVLRDPHAFDEAGLPFGEVLEAAGLERNGGLVAHSDEQWENAQALRDAWDELYGGDDDGDLGEAVELASQALDDASTPPEVLRHLLWLLEEPVAAGRVLTDVLVVDRRPSFGAAELAERLVAAAEEPPEVARAHWLAAAVCEAAGDLVAAEAHLEAGRRADRTDTAVVDRLAWYHSLRGGAAEAVRLWRSLGRTVEDEPEIAAVAEAVAAAGGGGRKLGRNDPCWCGSGRKFKQCHLGAAELPALPDRVSWLYAKAEGYLRRASMDGLASVLELVDVLVDDPDDLEQRLEAMSHPLLLDLVLEEWGEAELLESPFAALLPEDEQLLLASWQLVDRSVHEVDAVVPGESVDLRDLATGEVVTARERTFSEEARIGQLLCARVVPDGQQHQLLAGAIHVDPTSVEHLLAILEHGAPEDLVQWLADRSRPPHMATREGEDLVVCRAELDLASLAADEVAAALDERYEHEPNEPGAWRELVDLGDGGNGTIRATLRIEGDRLVVDTTSEERMDRVLDVLAEALPEAPVVVDEREPLDLGAARRRSGGGPGTAELSLPGPSMSPVEREALEQHMALMEERWCDEPVPALDGATPREAAADPIQRERLVRLIASFPEPDQDGATMSFRPSRLRQLLDL